MRDHDETTDRAGGCGADAERALDAAVARLERDITPARDLWPTIAAAQPRPVSRAPRYLALAASVVATAFGGLLALQFIGGGAPDDRPDDAPPAFADASAVPAEVTAAEAGYLAVRAERLASLDERLEALSPENRASVLQSLATIDRALGDLRAALADEPADPVLQHLLLSVYAQEMAVLTQLDEATRVADERSIDI